jgi:polar amino acid transport system substrate-binding protein
MIRLVEYPLKLKLLLVPSIAVVSFVSYLMYSSYVFSGGDDLLKQIRDTEFPKLNAAGENIKSFDGLLDALQTASSTGEVSYLKNSKEKSAEILNRFESMLEIDPGHKDQIEQMKIEFTSYFSLAFTVAQKMTTKTQIPSNQQLGQMQSLRNIYSRTAVSYRDAAEKEFQNTIRNAIASSEKAQMIGSLIGAIMLFIIGMLTWRVNRGIVKLEKTVENRNKRLTEVNNELEQEIKNLKAAEAASHIKDEFLANMSHELRTPMNAVIGLSHLCLQTDMSDKQQDYVHKINSSAKSLLGILNDILDVSKIEAGKMELDRIPFELSDEMDNLSTIFAAKSVEKKIAFNIEISPDIPPVLVGDPLRLGQVLINLAGNAVKFTSWGEVIVKAEMSKVSEEQIELQFSVKDTGIGLSQVQIDKLFQPFTQADSSITRKFGGTGLGLTISKRLVEMMGGKIWVESIPGLGSKFIFTAIFTKAEDQSSINKNKFIALRGLRVLAVDDNDKVLHILRTYLESFSLDVTVAKNRVKALSEIHAANQSGKPILLSIIKYNLWQTDGLALVNDIQNLTELSIKPKILLVTEYGQNDIPSILNNKILDGVLEKPLQKNKLFNAVAKIIGRDFMSTGKFMAAGIQFNAGLVSQIRGAHVLLVEDNEINQQIAQEMLASFGVSVTLAENGEEALACLLKENFDGILMDMQMPVMDGITATREIRKNSLWANLPILALTANVYISQQNELLAAGMNDHIGKPIDPDQLLATLAKWVRPGKTTVVETIAPTPKSTESVKLPELPGVKVAESIRRIGGNVVLYYALIEKFRTNQKDVVPNIRAALASSDLKTSERLVHTLRGVSGSLGAETLQKLAEQAEKSIHNNELVGLESLLDQIEIEIDILIKNIKQCLSARSG